MSRLFDLNGKVAIITGGGGLLGTQHAHTLADAGANPIIVDIIPDKAKLVADDINKLYRNVDARYEGRDATNESSMMYLLDYLVGEFGHTDILVNNVANNLPLASAGGETYRFESFGQIMWDFDLEMGLKSAFICSKVFGTWMAKHNGGVIVNIASDLSVIAPDQRLYRQDGVPEDKQPVKPVTYSVVKYGLIGLTRYLAAYWADKGVRVNALSPGGILNYQSDEFVKRVSSLIPLGRMANRDEMRGALLFLCSPASAYMTGQNIVVDGGRTVL